MLPGDRVVSRYPDQRPTVPAMSSVSEAEYRAAIEAGMTWTTEARRADTQRRIKAVAAANGGES